MLRHIFGVDIDEQAVEVTKLSLMLKMLDGERGIPVGRGILPMLDKNIKCGNSLISGSALELNKYFGDNWYLLKPFNWQEEFPQIMENNGGFDAVIGNPPWGADFSRSICSYLRSAYKTAQGELDSYSLFIELSVGLLKTKGIYGVIVPDTWLTIINACNLRRWLLTNFSLQRLIGLNESVFGQATVDPLIMILENRKPLKNHKVETSIIPKKEKIEDLSSLANHMTHLQADWQSGDTAQIKIYSSSDSSSIIDKLRSETAYLTDLIDYRAGCKPYEAGKGTPPQSLSTLKLKPFTSERQIDPGWKPLIRGNDIQRYVVRIKKPEWISYGPWLAAPRKPEIFKGPRILIQAIRNPSLPNRIIAAFSDEDLVSRINVYTLKKLESTRLSYYYLLGILNSSLMNWYLKKDYGLHTYVITGVLQLPIRLISFKNPFDGKAHEDLSSLVESIVAIKKHAEAAKGAEKEQLQRQIDRADGEIDDIVYELYGITQEERRIIEGK